MRSATAGCSALLASDISGRAEVVLLPMEGEQQDVPVSVFGPHDMVSHLLWTAQVAQHRG